MADSFHLQTREENYLMEHYCQLLSGADYVLIDSSAALLPACTFLLEAACFGYGSKPLPFSLILPAPCYAALKRHWVGRSRDGNKRQQMLMQQLTRHFSDSEKKHRYRCGQLHLLMAPESEWNAEHELEQKQERLCMLEDMFLLQEVNHLRAQALRQPGTKLSCIVITQEVVLSAALKALQAEVSPREDGSLPFSLQSLVMNTNGFLHHHGEDAVTGNEALQEMAAENLLSLVQQNRLYMDDSALAHPQAEDFLRKVKPALVQSGKALHLLLFKDKPLELSHLLMARAQETPPTARFVWLDSFRRAGMGTPEAQAEAMVSDMETSAGRAEPIVLITNRQLRLRWLEETLLSRQVPVSFYAINRHGYLTRRELAPAQAEAASTPKQKAEASARPAVNRELRALLEKATQLRQMTEKTQVRDEMKQAVLRGDVNHARNRAINTDALDAGIHAALCDGQADILAELVATADRIPAKTLRWWMLDSKMFRNPGYLSGNPQFYRLLVQALPKVEMTPTLAAKILSRLWELKAQAQASHVELQFLIGLFSKALETQPENTEFLRIRQENIPGDIPHSDELALVKIREKYQLTQKRVQMLQARISSLEQEQAKVRDELQASEREMKRLEQML